MKGKFRTGGATDDSCARMHYMYSRLEPGAKAKAKAKAKAIVVLQIYYLERTDGLPGASDLVLQALGYIGDTEIDLCIKGKLGKMKMELVDQFVRLVPC